MSVDVGTGRSVDSLTLPKADRIHALRELASSLDPVRAGQLLELAAQAAAAQAIAIHALSDAVGRAGSMGFFRESRPKAYAAHQAVARDTRMAGVYPYGAESAVLNASSAILFENEAILVGERVRETLMGPVVALFGTESQWIDRTD